MNLIDEENSKNLDLTIQSEFNLPDFEEFDPEDNALSELE